MEAMARAEVVGQALDLVQMMLKQVLGLVGLAT
jgi:hypothetical protein